jgi:hypothetical protein
MNPVRIINSLSIEYSLLRKSPLPLFAKEGLYSSLWKRDLPAGRQGLGGIL